MEVPERPSLAVYDDKDRDLIRRQLLRYMESHRIGVPTLQERISETVFGNDYSQDQVGFKSLQRFLANKHRTNETLVWYCHKFTLSIDAPDPVGTFGEAASSFFKNDSDPERLAGLASELFAYDTDSRANRNRDREDWDSYSRLVLDKQPQAQFLRVTEIIDDRTMRVGKTMSIREDDIHAEGVALMQGECILLLLRDALTRQFKSYVFSGGPTEGTNDHPGVLSAPVFDGAFIESSHSYNIAVSPRKEAAL